MSLGWGRRSCPRRRPAGFGPLFAAVDHLHGRIDLAHRGPVRLVGDRGKLRHAEGRKLLLELAALPRKAEEPVADLGRKLGLGIVDVAEKTRLEGSTVLAGDKIAVGITD